MPFQNLRINSEFFVLHKDGTPYIEVGSVTGVSNPVPEFMQQPLPYGQPPRMVVDITIKVGEQTVTFQKIPAMGTCIVMEWIDGITLEHWSGSRARWL